MTARIKICDWLVLAGWCTFFDPCAVQAAAAPALALTALALTALALAALAPAAALAQA